MKAFAKSYFGSAVLAGFGLAVVMVMVIFATGQTFGQRCEADGFAVQTQSWHSCIASLQHSK